VNTETFLYLILSIDNLLIGIEAISGLMGVDSAAKKSATICVQEDLWPKFD